MPSSAYWALLRHCDVRTVDPTIEGFFSRTLDHRTLDRVNVQTDEPEARETIPPTGLEPSLPPAPSDLLQTVTFELTPKQEASVDDPWFAMFLSAAEKRPRYSTDIVPYWIYAADGGATIERYVPALPLSKEQARYRRLLRAVGAYRLVVGQPRQDDLLGYVGNAAEDLAWLRIDLSPTGRQFR